MNFYENSVISDKDLLYECLQGKDWAWEIFYERFNRLISSVIRSTAIRYRMELLPEDMSDCEQAIWSSFFEKDYDKLRRFEGRSSLATYLKVCSCNATINYIRSYRSRNFRQTALDDQPASIFADKDYPSKAPEVMVSHQELLKKIAHIIEGHLSTRERLFATYHWFDDLSFDEIAQIMKISKHNLYLIRHRIIKKIRPFLKDSL